MQNPKFKYGLKNASAYLKHLRQQKHLEMSNEIETVHENTFLDEELYINPDTQDNKNDEQIFIKKQENKPSLSDMIVREHLKQILKTYRDDLVKLEENKQNIIDAIQQISQKIQNLPQLHTKNQNLELDNFKQRKQIEIAIKNHHQLRLELWEKKNKLCSKFMKKKEKLRKLLDLMQPELQERVYMQSWEQYFYSINKNKFDAERDAGQIKSKLQEKIIENLLNKNKNQKKQQPEQKMTQIMKKQKGDMLGDLKNFAKNFKMP